MMACGNKLENGIALIHEDRVDTIDTTDSSTQENVLNAMRNEQITRYNLTLLKYTHTFATYRHCEAPLRPEKRHHLLSRNPPEGAPFRE